MGLFYTTIRVRNVEKSIKFYSKEMGMKITDRKSYMPGETVITQTSKDTGQNLRLIHYEKNCRLYKPYEKGDEMDHLTFRVKNAKTLYQKLVKKGYKIAMPLWQGETVTMGYIKDPDGIWIGLISENK